MNARELANLFRISHYAITVNLEGFTQEQSLFQPPGRGNCVNWVLGHIVASRNGMLRLLGEEPVLHDAVAERYRRGSLPIGDEREAAHLELLVRALNESQERILHALGRIRELDLNKPAAAPGSQTGDTSVGGQLAFLHFHESYHSGQLGLLRRLAGKEGAIR
ncbi:MAG TPA: DinB family protein [Candidatus Eisenbacteria bacterium]